MINWCYGVVLDAFFPVAGFQLVADEMDMSCVPSRGVGE